VTSEEVQSNRSENLRNAECLRNIRIFSLLSVFSYTIDAVAIVLGIVILMRSLPSIVNPSGTTTPFIAVLNIELNIGALSIVATILMLVSFIFLRRGYRVLKEVSREFSSPYRGVNMFFIGLIVIVAGSAVLLPIVFFHLAFYAMIGIIAVVMVGSILAFIGEILALIVGPFKLKTYFNEPAFGTAGILMIIGLFVPFVSIAGVALIYKGANSLLLI